MHMKKTSSFLKKLFLAGDKPALQQTKPVPKPGKLGKEIDDIFGGRQKKKPELGTTEKKETPVKKTEMARRKWKRKRSELDGFKNNPQTRPRKRTEDGLLVFTEDELDINKANADDTSLCHFDCSCCFFFF
ncbi:hypothetical protein EUTSA_v10027214mg [Eutrema salsugineum]|uniref:Uncharacterized protein n=1 Tax=Eutrema salsugineum TaxID=72664 RepID=V4MEP9_EUTSA|nr:hypothetical protein EUTSA_v10027214mg [Eutrema salsugineum]